MSYVVEIFPPLAPEAGQLVTGLEVDLTITDPQDIHTATATTQIKSFRLRVTALSGSAGTIQGKLTKYNASTQTSTDMTGVIQFFGLDAVSDVFQFPMIGAQPALVQGETLRLVLTTASGAATMDARIDVEGAAVT